VAGCREGSCFAFFRFEVTFAAVFPPTNDPFFPTYFRLEVTFAPVFPPTIDPFFPTFFEVTFATVFPPTIDPFFFPTFCSKNYFCFTMVCS